MWLCSMSVHEVSISTVWHLTNVSRYEFYSSALTPGSKDPVEPFQRASMWLRSVCSC